MKASELRVNNIVKRYGDNNKEEHHTISIDDFKHLNDALKFFYPIPLTEEWENKLGVTIKRAVGNNGIPLIFLNSSQSDGVYCTHVKLEYVHQLQNLYFALTGEELTLTQ